jgi:hypothetical protein
VSTEPPVHPSLPNDLWADALASLRLYGLGVPADCDDQLAGLIAPAAPSVLVAGEPADALVAAWRATQKRSPGLSGEIWLAALLAFRAGFDLGGHGLHDALAAYGMGVQRTQLEVRLRLGGQLFFFGRRNVAHEHLSIGARLLLADAVSVFEEIVGRDGRLSPSVQRGFRGMLGIASLLLARDTEQPLPLIETAVAQLTIAEELGDRSGGHYAYLIEALLAGHELTGDAVWLERAAGAWQRASDADRTRSLLSNGAQLHESRARAALLADASSDAVLAFQQAEALLTEALAGHGADSGTDDGFLMAVRARVRHQLFRHDVDAGGRRRTHWLTLAEEDMAAPGTNAHLGAGAQVPVLLDRVRRLARSGEHRTALELLGEVDDLLGEHALADSLTLHARAARLDSELFLAVAQRHAATAVERLEALLDLPGEVSAPSGALALGTRFLLAYMPDDARPRALGSRAVERLTHDLASQPLSPTARRHVAGHAARLAWMLARENEDPEDLANAARLFSLALSADVGAASPMLLADGGSCALRLAKADMEANVADTDELEALLTDAATWLHDGLARGEQVTYDLDASFEVALLQSRAGEAFARLHAVTGSDAHLALTIEHLQRAQQLGHPWKALSGHLADALYRRGRRTRAEVDLRQAIALKDDDFAAGRSSRENRSVAAAASLTLFDIGGDAADLDAAARYAMEAATQDSTWPWPALQLGEAVRAAAGRPLKLDVAACIASPRGLSELVGRSDADGLWRYAAALAVASPEFSPSSLEGQTRGGRAVYVLADPHRLLERTLVLKRVPSDSAHNEAQTTRAFAAYLARTNSPTTWQLPEPLAVIEHPTQPGKAVYVMRRAQGPTLGTLAGRADEAAVMDQLESAVRYLAAFCSWARDASDVPPMLSPKRIKRMSSALFDRGRRLGLTQSTANRVAKGLGRAIEEMPAVAKKDAHAANWLRTPDGNLVALDLESTSNVPLLWEVAQLLDDYPFLAVDDAGWQLRIRLCDAHLDELARRGSPLAVAPERLSGLLAWFAFAHAASNLGRLGEHADDWRVSSSGLARRRARRAHTVAVLAYLARTAVDDGLRYGAQRLVDVQSGFV